MVPIEIVGVMILIVFLGIVLYIMHKEK